MEEKEQTNIYPYPYAVREGCLCMETASNGYISQFLFGLDEGQELNAGA